MRWNLPEMPSSAALYWSAARCWWCLSRGRTWPWCGTRGRASPWPGRLRSRSAWLLQVGRGGRRRRLEGGPVGWLWWPGVRGARSCSQLWMLTHLKERKKLHVRSCFTALHDESYLQFSTYTPCHENCYAREFGTKLLYNYLVLISVSLNFNLRDTISLL